jgi:hypothetical protein
MTLIKAYLKFGQAEKPRKAPVPVSPGYRVAQGYAQFAFGRKAVERCSTG